ncbi:TolC family outer membrane protein [Bradyrhizobium sp. CCGUVB14]|uniref:TolC family outer membrane protein n=1 Tax=Bradyrhizobium sp. CCGUVB14 TaxID=2949628 RepID=UPI0020B207FA|nr:TolC family outer membrane protein [Bradyrhizobium sp. CCGUVB14]MCP3447323.1 TolC family outer membrane protein [Bradyrhizobium sp. CCGUVB14]
MKYLLALALAMLFTARPAFAETLEQALVQAYQNNPSLEAARAKLRATDEEVSQALSHYRPTVDANAQAGRTFQDIPALAGSSWAGNTRGLGVQLTQPLFRFRTLAEVEEAEKGVRAERANLQTSEQQLFLDTATAYLDILRDESILAINQQNQELLSQKLQETSDRARYGDLTDTDVEQAKSRLARARVRCLESENQLATDKAAYARLVGRAPGRLEAPALSMASAHTVEEMLHRAESENPAVVAARFRVEAADADVDANKGSLLPEVNLVGNASRNWDQSSTIPGRGDTAQVLVQLTMPLYRAGADYSRIRAAQETNTQRRMEMADTQHRAHEAAANAWQTLTMSEAAMTSDRLEIAAAGRALEGVREQSRVGTRTMLDVLNAQEEWLDAKVDLARAEHDHALSILQLRGATGQLTADALKLPVDVYDPERHYNEVRDAWVGF